ncbi:hypothetical protein SAMN05428966_109286 [Massilia sp. PDC64]|nr:hypothetical protein [Massilia sp. PDC64]SDE63662.1 hypothetical protein SAMN05428966_109286 [Massilia sp. PDC64]
MKFSHLLLFAAGVPLLAAAQADRAMPDASSPNAPVAPLQYRSVFADYVTASAPVQSPDKAWAAANRAVLGDQAEASAPGQQAGAGAAPATSAKTAHDQHDHEGSHK